MRSAPLSGRQISSSRSLGSPTAVDLAAWRLRINLQPPGTRRRLRRLAAAPRLFRSDALATAFEQRARTNIKRHLVATQWSLTAAGLLDTAGS